MSLVVPREVSVTYAGLTFGNGGANTYADRYHVDGPFRLRRSKLDFEFRCRITVTMRPGDTDADFATACAQVENTFKTPRSTLTVAFNASQHVDFVEGVAAYGIAATVEKAPDGPNTRRSRSYDCTVTGSVTAQDRSDFLRAIEWTLTYSSSRRRTLEITGTYTRSAASGALAVYQAGIATRATAIQNLVGGGTWELADESATGNVDDTEARFRRVYEEVIFNQATGLLDDPRIVRQVLSVRRPRPAPGDSPVPTGKVRRLQRAVVTYAAAVDKTLTTDLAGLWTSTVRPWLLVAARALLGSSTVALVHDDPDFHGPQNVLSATLELLATRDSALLACTVSQRTSVDHGNVSRKLWDAPGDPVALVPPGAYVLRTPCAIRRTRTTSTETLGADAPPGGPSPGDAGGGQGSALGIFGLGQQVGLDFGGAGLGVFGIGEDLDLVFGGQGRDEREAARGSEGAAAGAGGGGGPAWVPATDETDQVVKTYGGDGGEFSTTITTRVQVWELLNVRPAPLSAGAGGDGAGGGPTSVVRAES